ncbi:MAG: hypothetical protein JWQ74_2218 [Marmoricola sp.]|nr:hypothetical protein [Marmoricola sp.]
MTTARRILPRLLVVAALALGAAACADITSEPTGESAPHTHTSRPAGDGTRASYVGYALADLTFPKKAGIPGTLSFQITTYQGAAQKDFATELTKKMHVYVVRSDLSLLRHVHPTMAADGTWSGNLTVPVDGTYRVVTEFTALGPGGKADQLVLGDERSLGKPVASLAVPAATTSATHDGLTVTVGDPPTVGYEHQMTLGISKGSEPAALGTYLSVYAHVSAFNVKTGALVHMHPLGSPETKDGQSVLSFHTGFEVPGDYRMFVQTRVSGIVHTIPITVAVTGQQAPEL